MWELGAAAAAIAALLVPAAPVPDLPPLPPSGPDHGCVVPLGTVLDPCARDDDRPPVLCVVPVTRSVPPTLETTCPDHVPDPRGRFVPVTP